MTFIWIFKWIFERVSEICEKQFKHVLFLNKCFKHEMFLGQITVKPSFLNDFFAKHEFHCSFTVSRRTARSRRSRRRNKDMPRYTMISRRVAHARTHATQTQTRNTTSRLAVSQRTHPPNLRYKLIKPYKHTKCFRGVVGVY